MIKVKAPHPLAGKMAADQIYDLFTYVTPAKEELSAEDVRQILQTRFHEEGRTDRTVGAIRAHGADYLRAEIMSLNGDILKTVEINKHTGAWSV